MSNREMSIQLRLDGHSFSCATLPEVSADDVTVTVELLTAKVTLVPTECFEVDLAEKYLRMAGVVCAEDELPVYGEADGVTMVAAVPRECAGVLEERFAGRLKYTSPLLRNTAGEKRYIYVYNAAGVAYLKLFHDTRFEFYEVVPVTTCDDVLYVLARVVEEFELTDFVVKVAGEESSALVKLLKKYYKVERCE